VQPVGKCHDRTRKNDGKPTFSPTIAESRTSQDAQNGNALEKRAHKLDL